MRKLPIDKLKPGMKVARTVYSSDGYILLAAGVVLKERYIRQLKFFDVPAIYVEDDLLPDVEVEDVISEKTRVEAIITVKEMLTNVRQQVQSGKRFLLSGPKLKETVEDIIKDLLTRKKLIVNLNDIRSTDSYTFAHSVNVCVLAVLTGIALNFSKSQLLQLGMGALMHDVGKIIVPLEILNKPGRLTAEEYKIIQRHSEFGYEILQSQPGISKMSAKVAFEHHEKYDGSGYPLGLKGEEIHLYSRIVGIVDVYDALTADRVYRKGYLPHEAYEYLAATGGSMFDYDLVKVFLSHVAAYPVGTIVRLNTGEVGVVVETPIGMTTRPVVRVLYRDGHVLKKPYEIKLYESYRVLISDVLSDDEWQKIILAKESHGP